MVWDYFFPRTLDVCRLNYVHSALDFFYNLCFIDKSCKINVILASHHSRNLWSRLPFWTIHSLHILAECLCSFWSYDCSCSSLLHMLLKSLKTKIEIFIIKLSHKIGYQSSNKSLIFVLFVSFSICWSLNYFWRMDFKLFNFDWSQLERKSSFLSSYFLDDYHYF